MRRLVALVRGDQPPGVHVAEGDESKDQRRQDADAANQNHSHGHHTHSEGIRSFASGRSLDEALALGRPKSTFKVACSRPERQGKIRQRAEIVAFIAGPGPRERYVREGVDLMRAVGEQAAAPVPPELRAAIDANAELKDALQATGLPVDFQAMVLGLAAFRTLKSPARRAGAPAESR